ncbi:hypothetical protein FBU30_007511 [Linnemannia zychae]|nr:hypothetical protein FBU30_007511 [Linnemannia zychae]
MAPFVVPKAWFNRRGGAGNKKTLPSEFSPASSNTIVTPHSVFPSSYDPDKYHQYDSRGYNKSTFTPFSTPTKVDITRARAIRRRQKSHSSPISPPATTVSATTTLITTNSRNSYIKETTQQQVSSSPAGSESGKIAVASAPIPQIPPSSPLLPPLPTVETTISPIKDYSSNIPWSSLTPEQQQHEHYYQQLIHPISAKAMMSEPIASLQTQLLSRQSSTIVDRKIKVSTRARQYLNRVQMSFSRSTLHLNQQQQQLKKQQQPNDKHEQQVQQQLQQQQLENQSSQKAFSYSASRFRSSTENLRAMETVAQEYARTIKALWQMVEEEELSQRLADATPEEREWIIMHHSNQSESSTLASCYYIPNQLCNFPKDHFRYSQESNPSQESHIGGSVTGSSTSGTGSGYSGGGSTPLSAPSSRANSRLGFAIDPVYSYNKNHYTHHSQPEQSYRHSQSQPLSPICESSYKSNSSGSTIQETCQIHRRTFSSNSNDVDDFHEPTCEHSIHRKGARVSNQVKLSAMELEKHDHYTLQERIQLEEDWRMKAKLTQGMSTSTTTPSSSPQKRQSHLNSHRQSEEVSYHLIYQHGTFPEYEPPVAIYDDKEEYESAVDLSLDLNEEFYSPRTSISSQSRLVSTLLSNNREFHGIDEGDDENDEDDIDDEEKAAVLKENQKELEELERQLGLLGLNRFKHESELFGYGGAFAEGESTCSGDDMTDFSHDDLEDVEAVVGIAHKVGVRESRLFYHHARSASPQGMAAI